MDGVKKEDYDISYKGVLGKRKKKKKEAEPRFPPSPPMSPFEKPIEQQEVEGVSNPK